MISRDFKARVVTLAHEVITIDTSSPELLTTLSSRKQLPIPTAFEPTRSSWNRPSMSDFRDRYPNLFESSPPEPSSVESAVPPAIATATPGTFPESAPTSLRGTEVANTLPDIPPEALTTNLPPTPTEESSPSLPVALPEVRTRTGREIRPPARFGEWGEMALFGLGDSDEPSVSQALRSVEATE